MNATVLQFPGVTDAAPPADRPGLNLSYKEVIEASGGYVRAADQLRALHARGFVRAWRRPGGPVILERAHHDAVVRGQYGHQAAPTENEPPPARPRPNRAALQQRYPGRNK